MPVTRTMEPDGILITEVSGTIESSDIINGLDELLDYAINDEIYEIVIYHPDTNALDTSSDDVSSVVYKAKIVLKKFKKAVIVFVSDQDLIFGLSRMGQMQVESENIYMNVVRTVESARAWINEMRTPNLGVHGASQTPRRP